MLYYRNYSLVPSGRRLSISIMRSAVVAVSEGALADEALQLWDQAEALLEERVDG
jgi:hypothetical protein